MNIFLDKSLPKKTQNILQVVRVILIIIVFGGMFYCSFNAEATNVLLYSGVLLAVIFWVIKMIFVKRQRNLAKNAQLNKVTDVPGSDPE
jgi:Na+(H+)/acetate symporter ActP